MLGILDRASHARHYFDTLLNQTSYQAGYQTCKTIPCATGSAPVAVLPGAFACRATNQCRTVPSCWARWPKGVTEVKGFLEGEDSLATLQAFREMGVAIEGPHQGRVTIHGVGMHGLKAPAGPIYVGNSGTAMRLFAGLLAGQAFDSELTGDAH